MYLGVKVRNQLWQKEERLSHGQVLGVGVVNCFITRYTRNTRYTRYLEVRASLRQCGVQTPHYGLVSYHSQPGEVQAPQLENR